VYLVGGLSIQMERDLGTNAAILGAAIALYWAVSAVLSAVGGVAAHHLGIRKGMLLSVAIGLSSLLGIACGSHHWAALFPWLAVAGVANALGQPVSNALLVAQVSIQRRAFSFGLKQAAVPAATLTAGLAVPLIAVSLGWQWAFAGAALFAAVLLALLARMVPAGPPTGGHAAAGFRPPRLPRQLNGFLLATAAAGTMGSSAGAILGAFTVSTAVHNGFDPAAAGLMLSLGSAAGCITRPLMGIAADKGIGGSMATVALMMALGAIGMAAMSSGNLVAFAIGCVFAFGFGWGWNGLAHYIVAHRSGSFAAQATGISQTGTNLGGTLGPLVFGLIFTALGPTRGWIFAAAISATSAGAALIAHQLEKRLIAV
jgi:MFS family permease